MVSRDRIEELWYTKKSNAEIQAELGVSKGQLAAAKRHYRLPQRDTRVWAEPGKDEIEAMCLAFQRSWSDEERARRYAWARTVKMVTPSGRLAR